jgi:hypothetical protein
VISAATTMAWPGNATRGMAMLGMARQGRARRARVLANGHTMALV